MKIDAEMILEKHCPSMSNLYLDAQGRNFRDRVVNAMIEYHQTEVKKFSKVDVIKSVCDRCEGRPENSDSKLCDNCYSDLHGM